MKTLAKILVCCIVFAGVPVYADSTPPVAVNVGLLTFLNTTEQDFVLYRRGAFFVNNYLADEGFLKVSDAFYNGSNFVMRHFFYDDLNAMVMALKSGILNRITISQTTAKYVASHDSDIGLILEFDLKKEKSPFVEQLLTYQGFGYSFLLRKDSAELWKEFNKAIADIKADGTLNRLIQEQIYDAIDNKEIQPVELAKIEGSETIRVAVTGSLPPMDYVAPNGTPAGFNTVVLSEISKRIGKNIELTVVDSIGRAAALSSGKVDVVFWASSPLIAYEDYAPKKDGMTAKQAAIIDELERGFQAEEYKTVDIPEGTLITEPYYTDYLVSLYLK